MLFNRDPPVHVRLGAYFRLRVMYIDSQTRQREIVLVGGSAMIDVSILLAFKYYG